MAWRITREDVELFRRELWKDERSIGPINDPTVFEKDCLNVESAHRELAALQILTDHGGEQLCPQPIGTLGSTLQMRAVNGMRLFEVLRALREIELRRRDGAANEARSVLIARQRQRLAIIQRLLLAHTEELGTVPYPLQEKIGSLLMLLARVLGVSVAASVDDELDKLATYWESACGQVPFRDATPKNTIVEHIDLRRSARLSDGEGDVHSVDRMLSTYGIEVWESVPLFDVDFSSVEHLTTFEDDPISLHFHEWTFGSCPLVPESLLLMPGEARADAYRTAASLMIRFLRFGGRKLAYRLFNSQGFEIRFRYDDPLFYFRRLRELIVDLSEEFAHDFGSIVALVSAIGDSAGHPSSADRQLLAIDHFRAVYGHGADYWPENPIDLGGVE